MAIINQQAQNEQAMQNNYRTQRLLLTELTLGDAEFILELVNTPEWIQYIGNRNINSQEDATAYIQKIIDDPATNYWIVKIQDQRIPIGIITFIKREYLQHHDIGFAFLSQHTKQGYAYEATTAVLSAVLKDPAHAQILATTVKENTNSIQLLKKLGFRFSKKVKSENITLLVYSLLQ